MYSRLENTSEFVDAKVCVLVSYVFSVKNGFCIKYVMAWVCAPVHVDMWDIHPTLPCSVIQPNPNPNPNPSPNPNPIPPVLSHTAWFSSSARAYDPR